MDIDSLRNLRVFANMERQDVETIVGYCDTVEIPQGTSLFEKDDPGGTLFIVVKGSVQINAQITHNLKKSLSHVPPGGVCGELSLFTRDPRSASAVATADSVLLRITSDTILRLLQENPTAGSRLLIFLLNIISDRMRNTNDMYRQALEWSLSVSGAIDFHMDQLITNNVDLTVKLTSGELLKGRLLKVDQNVAGHVLFMESVDGSLEIVPYQAITVMTFDRGGLDLQPHTDLL